MEEAAGKVTRVLEEREGKVEREKREAGEEKAALAEAREVTGAAAAAFSALAPEVRFRLHFVSSLGAHVFMQLQAMVFLCVAFSHPRRVPVHSVLVPPHTSTVNPCRVLFWRCLLL